MEKFPQLFVIHTVKGFDRDNTSEIDVFLELSCFFHDPADVGNLISGSSAFSKTSLNRTLPVGPITERTSENYCLPLISCFSRVRLCATPETAHQAPQSLGFSRQEHWSGLPFPSPIIHCFLHTIYRSFSNVSFSPHLKLYLLGSVLWIFEPRIWVLDSIFSSALSLLQLQKYSSVFTVTKSECKFREIQSVVSHGCQSPFHLNSVATLPVVARHFSFLQKQLFSTSPLPSSFWPHHLFLFSHRKWKQPDRDFFNLLSNEITLRYVHLWF